MKWSRLFLATTYYYYFRSPRSFVARSINY